MPFEWLRQAVGDTLFFYAVTPAIKIAIVLFVGVLPLIMYLTLAERRILGFLQVRLGPNRVGPWGLLQPFADVLKLLVKEDIVPNRAVRWAFVLAPCLVVGPAFLILSVVPFGPRAAESGVGNYFITDLNVGVLFVVAVATIGVYGILLGGWASNSKFSLLGGLRSAAQMISYEVPQGFALIGPLLLAGSLSLVEIVEAQRASGWWFVFPQIVAFFLFLVAGVAESNRSPFDLPEAESELVAGFHTEYSGMRFALFFLGEYANMIVISSMAVTLFLGGWLPPSRMAPFMGWLSFLDLEFLPFGLAGLVWFVIKLLGFLFLYIWFRGTFPRYRFDQLMELGWKWMIPVALANLAVTGLLKVI